MDCLLTTFFVHHTIFGIIAPELAMTRNDNAWPARIAASFLDADVELGVDSNSLR